MKRLITIGLLSVAAGLFASPVAYANDLKEQQVRSRAVESVIWSMPAIGIRKFVKSTFEDYGATWNDVLLWSKPPLPRHEALTANNQLPYMLTSFNLRNGPIVVDVPPAGDKALLFGSFVDNWQAPIVDVGPAGEDKGKGGKYLFLPPGYSDPIPEGYIPVRMQGYVVAGGLRPVPTNGGTTEDAHSYAQRFQIYPLAEAVAPKPTRFIDGYLKPFHSLPVYDSSWFRELAAFVNEEPVRERDKVMMGMLASIGIERGKPFAPDAKLQATLDAAITDARNLMQDYLVTPGRTLTPWWPNGQWSAPAPELQKKSNGATYVTDDALWLDARGGGAFYWGTFVPKQLGDGTFYLTGLRDSAGNLFDGQSTYRLRVPYDVPVRQFWSAIVYDMDTKAFACVGPCEKASNAVGLSSYDKPSMKVNADGSVDIYFGPKAPAGYEKNWVTTAGKSFFLIFRLYGPEPQLFDRSWKLPDVERVE